MTTDELVDAANRTLIEDFKNHPARFGRGQVLPFRLKASRASRPRAHSQYERRLSHGAQHRRLSAHG